jgi:predicted RNase H-like HicB family nuclease
MLKPSIPSKSLPIIMEMDQEGVYTFSFPLLKAYRSYGGTEEEAMENLKEVIQISREEEPSAEFNRYVGFIRK